MSTNWTQLGDQAVARYRAQVAAWKRLGAEIESLGAKIINPHPPALEIDPGSLATVTEHFRALWSCTRVGRGALLIWDRSDGIHFRCHVPSGQGHEAIVAAALMRGRR